MIKKIGLFTSGGDAPGMNACIRAVVRTAIYHGIEIFGIERGYVGMIDNMIIPMNSHSVSNIIQRGGTILKCARSTEFMTVEGRQKAFVNLETHGIDGLIAIGGNGTYTGGIKFYEEFGIPIIGVPGTIDNDLYGTDYTIGYDTAINTALQAIDKIRDTADSFDRMFFVEVMGRDAGFIAMDVGIGGGAEAIFIPEFEESIEDMVAMIKKGWGRKKTSQLIIVAEGDEHGNAFEIAEAIKKRIPDFEYRVTVLGHIQRGGSPSARDRVLASRLGQAAVDGLIKGYNQEAVGIVNDIITYTPLAEAIGKRKEISKDLVKLVEILSN